MVADNKQRYKRLRLLIRKLNKERKKQAKKIDILCNDLIAAQRKFIHRLNIISFTANFYESILGSTDLEDLLHTAARMIKIENADTNVSFFLRQEPAANLLQHVGDESSTEPTTGFELYMFESSRTNILGGEHSVDGARDWFENCFSPELMESICKSNKVCTLDDMLALDMQGNLTGLNNVSAVTIPLGQAGSLLGFILIYRSATNKLTATEIDRIRAVTGGLSQAIASCHTPSHPKP